MAESEQYQGQPAEGFKPLEEWGKVDAFSSEELEAWKRSPVSRLESRVIATIDALQTALEGAEAESRRLRRSGANASGLFIEAVETGGKAITEIERERDEARALAKLRGEALNNMWGLHHGFSHKGHLDRETCPATSCQDARAAIDATPAREKEARP